MSKGRSLTGAAEKWAHFRFSVIGPLLAAPPEQGQLQARLQELAAQQWEHPISGKRVSFGLSTIERWYYQALNGKQDPVGVLKRKVRCDSGWPRSLSPALREVLTQQYRLHPNWTYQLHFDNLGVEVERRPELGTMPSYISLRRFMQARGLLKRPRRGPAHSPGAIRAEERFQEREVRGFESPYVHSLWHLDFHTGSLPVLLPTGRWAKPHLVAILDDFSRLCCHAQWYLSENALHLYHGLCQAFQKRDLPRELMHDNGAAMIASEIQEGLARLGILSAHTLPYSPYQNGKQEVFWNQIEGRLLAMLEGVAELTLERLNQITQAWVEMEYNKKPHRALNCSPLERFRDHRDVGRPCPGTEQLQQAFTTQVSRKQRQSDGTLSVEGARFEIPSRFGHFRQCHIRYASWDLSRVWLCDPKESTILAALYPQDKQRNADAKRRLRAEASQEPSTTAETSPGMAPLLEKLLAEYAATGLPPAYLPHNPLNDDDNE